jgi:hypothetical protein
VNTGAASIYHRPAVPDASAGGAHLLWRWRSTTAQPSPAHLLDSAGEIHQGLAPASSFKGNTGDLRQGLTQVTSIRAGMADLQAGPTQASSGRGNTGKLPVHGGDEIGDGATRLVGGRGRRAWWEAECCELSGPPTTAILVGGRRRDWWVAGGEVGRWAVAWLDRRHG